MRCIIQVWVLTFILSALTGCAAITNEPSSQLSYQPEYGYVTSAYSYPGYNYYPSRPSDLETHNNTKK